MRHPIKNAMETLLANGRKALIDKGYANLNIKELAADCEMSTGSVYSYFSGKDDLVLQIMGRDWDRIIATAMSEAKGDGPLRGKLKHVYDGFVDFVLDYRFTLGGSARISSANLESRALYMQKMYDAIAALLRAEAAKGLLSDHIAPEAASYLLTHLLVAAGRNPSISFDKLWNCLAFESCVKGR